MKYFDACYVMCDILYFQIINVKMEPRVMMALLSTPAHALMDLMGLCVATISMTAHQPCALTMLHAWIRLLITPVTAALVSLVSVLLMGYFNT